MIQTLSTSEAADILKRDEHARWSYQGAYALCEWLEEMETGGPPIEFDCVAIRCEYSEWKTALEAALEYGYEPEDADDADDDSKEEAANDWLNERTTWIRFDGGVIIGSF